MGGHRSSICGGAAAWLAYSLGDVKDDACEAIFVEVDFLVVWDLTDCARSTCQSQSERGRRGAWYLTSANVEGSSTIRAPPNRGVLRKVAISEAQDNFVA